MLKYERNEQSYHGDEASDEAEVFEVVWVDGRSWVDLQAVVVLTGVFKQAVHGVQHLVGHQEEPLPTGDVLLHHIMSLYVAL